MRAPLGENTQRLMFSLPVICARAWLHQPPGEQGICVVAYRRLYRVRYQTQLAHDFLQHRNGPTVGFTVPIDAADAHARVEPLQDSLKLLLGDHAALVRGHQVISITVLVIRALCDQALGLSHIPHIDNIPEHARVTVPLQHVPNTRLP